MQDPVIPDLVDSDAVCAVSPQISAREAADIMTTKNLSALPVIDEGRLVGLLSEQELTRNLLAAGRDPDKTPVSQIMNRTFDSLAATDSIGWAVELMRIRGHHQLPVLDADGDLVGMAYIHDLLRVLGDRLDRYQKQQEERLFGTSHRLDDSK